MSARRLFPYVATLLLLLALAAVFVLRPTPFIGATAGAMDASLGDALPAGTAVSCAETGADEWSCDASGASVPDGSARTYDVTVNRFGCWTATSTGGVARVGTSATITGCITLLDH